MSFYGEEAGTSWQSDHGWKEIVALPRGFESLHSPLSLPRWLMGVLGSIVQALV